MSHSLSLFDAVPDTAVDAPVYRSPQGERSGKPRFVAVTSRKAYDELKPTLPGRELFVLAELRAYEREQGTQPTAYELVKFTAARWPDHGVDLNTIRPRLTSLYKTRKLIEKAEKRACAVTGKTAWTWRVR